MDTSKKRTTSSAAKTNQESTTHAAPDSSNANGLLQYIKEADVALTNALAVCARDRSKLGFLRPVMKFLEFSAHGIPWLSVTFILIFASHRISFQEKMINLFWAMLLDLAVVGIIKAIVRRKRPALNEMDMFGTVSVDKFSFPSGHTTRAAMTALFFINNFCSRTLCSTLIILWSTMIGISRILLGRHHVIDVGCGFIVGCIVYQQLTLRLWIPTASCKKIVQYVQEHFYL